MLTMAIKYVVLPEKKQVIAILKNTRYDAYNKAMKYCRQVAEGQTRVYVCPNPNKLLMPNEFRGVATCLEGDEFDVEFGKTTAKKICLAKYYKSFDKRIAAFKEDLDIVRMRSLIIANEREPRD